MQFHLYGFMIGLGIAAGYLVADWRRKRYGISERQLNRLFITVALTGIIGARIYHVLDLHAYYFLHPGEILSVWNGGLGIYGGIIGGLLGVLLSYYLFSYTYSSDLLISKFKIQKSKFKNTIQNSKISLLILFDFLVPPLAIGQAMGRIGNFFNQEGFGPPTNLPWGVYIDVAHRPAQWITFERFHPVFFYESLWMGIGFMVLMIVEYRRGVMHYAPTKGLLFAIYLIWYGFGRFFLEFLRFDTARIFSEPTAQIMSIFFVFLGIMFFLRVLTKTSRSGRIKLQ